MGGNGEEILCEQGCTILNASLARKLCLKPVSLPLNRKAGEVEMSDSRGRETLNFPNSAPPSLCKLQRSLFPPREALVSPHTWITAFEVAGGRAIRARCSAS